MTGFWAKHRRQGVSSLGALLVSAGVGTISAGAQTEAIGQDPLELFAQLMPVFSSPRCANCHGGTNPATDLNHAGGQVDVPLDGPGGDMSLENGKNQACLECHTAPAAAAGGWRLAPKRLSFVGKDTLALCRQFRTEQFSVNTRTDVGRAAWLEHLQTDQLIGVGFVGNGGVDENSPLVDDVSVEPPPMSKGEFLARAQRWLKDGQGACTNKWNGTITEDATFAEKVTFAPAPGGREVKQDTHTVITVAENVVTAEVHWTMTDFTDVPLKECQAFVHHTFTAAGYKLPVDMTIELGTPAIPSGTAPGQLPPGFELPPGVELPPGFEFPSSGLPPGITLPPGMTIPSMTVGPFVQYLPTSDAEVTGNHHSDLQSMDGHNCVKNVQDERHPYHMAPGMIEVTSKFAPPFGDPDDANHLVGEKVTKAANGQTTLKWDLSRDQE
jgi:hypothetical protein